MNPRLPYRIVMSVACAALAVSCTQETRVVHDLVELFPAAEIQRPTVAIDFTDPASLRHLIGGFETNRRLAADGRLRVCSKTADAKLEFFVDRVYDLDVDLEVMPLDPTQTLGLTLGVNGASWTELALRGRQHRHVLHLPGGLLRRGVNQLLITPTGDHAVGDRRLLLWKRICFRSSRSDAGLVPRANREEGTLFIPFGNRLDFYLELPPQSELRIERISLHGVVGGRFEITWAPIGGDERLLAVPSRRYDGAIEEVGGNGRLSFFAVADLPTSSSGGVLITAPTVRTAASEGAPVAATSRPTKSLTVRPDIVIYMIDALRADHLGCYGYQRPTSPHIDRFAEVAVLFENAQAQSSWTRPSVASVMTGLLPQAHGANDSGDALAGELVTLAELLKDAGYLTLAVSCNGNAGADVGFSQGFDQFVQLEEDVRSARVNDVAAALLDQYRGEPEPVFLFLHTFDPHVPYRPPGPFRERFAAFVDDPRLGSKRYIQELQGRQRTADQHVVRSLIALYDAEIAANDASFGAFLEMLARRRAHEDPIIILLSDHGEEFFDHGGWVHGQTLYAEMLDTPLIIAMPGMRQGRRVRQIAQHIDIMPTLVDYLGLVHPTWSQGRSLLPIMGGMAEPGSGDRALAHLEFRGMLISSLIDGPWKMIQQRNPRGDRFPELYDLRADDSEIDNLAEKHADRARMLAAHRRLAELAAQSAGAAPEARLSEEVRRQLEAIGYGPGT